MSKIYDAVVIGAGIIGVTTAEALHAKGLSVLVIDKNELSAAETSHANGGLITPGMAEPWASSGLPMKMLSWIGKEHAPSFVHLSALPSMFRWGIAFLKNCSDKKWEVNAKRMINLGCYSHDCLLEVADRYNLGHHIDRLGSLRIFSDKKTSDSSLSAIQFMSDNGINCRELTIDECIEMEPALEHLRDDLVSAFYYPDDLSGDCCVFARALSLVLEQRGVQFEYSTSVESIGKVDGERWQLTTSKGEFLTKNIVCATGFASSKLLGKAARKLLCYPVKGYSQTFTVPQSDIEAALKVPIMDDQKKVGVVRMGDKLRVVGTAEFCGHNTDQTPARLNALYKSTISILPSIENHELFKNWACCRPMPPDGVPYIGKLDDGLFANIGHGSLGWTNASGAAALLTDIMVGNTPKIDMHDYAPREH